MPRREILEKYATAAESTREPSISVETAGFDSRSSLCQASRGSSCRQHVQLTIQDGTNVLWRNEPPGYVCATKDPSVLDRLDQVRLAVLGAESNAGGPFEQSGDIDHGAIDVLSCAKLFPKGMDLSDENSTDDSPLPPWKVTFYQRIA
ncbi:MAG: hypothetical protein NTU79_18075 [Planctomycetota bacterium]|nr:hypothetical protein [Planctomycetota bacterium]